MWSLLEIPLIAVIVALLVRIGLVDFRIQKIANRDVLALAVLGLCWGVLRVVQTPPELRGDAWLAFWLGMALAAALFLVGLVFWLMRKMGAGDVKLLGAAPLVTGGEHLLLFSVALLASVLVTVAVIRYPLILPQPFFARYIEHLDRRRIVPFGVPISAAVIVVAVYELAARPWW